PPPPPTPPPPPPFPRGGVPATPRWEGPNSSSTPPDGEAWAAPRQLARARAGPHAPGVRWEEEGGGPCRPLSPVLSALAKANDEFDAPRPLAAQALSAAALASAGEPGGGVGEGSRSIGSQGLPAAGAPRRNSPASAGPAAHDAGGGIRSPPCVPPAGLAMGRAPI
ncbi:unnamed protein product, partial [Prorocentrum cordatum]